MLFGYFVVLPAAVRFFVNFNSSEFNVLVQASQFYSFAATILLAMGLVFQVPVRDPRRDPRWAWSRRKQLRQNRRYAIVACAAVAAFLPGDAITLLLETVPLYLLYEASILLAAFVRPAGADLRDAGSTSTEGRSGLRGAAGAEPDEPAEPTVQDMIDHVDPRLSTMLFDLRGRGRRRTVRVIYIGLALLMGVGLVGFGIGGGFGGGGLLNAASNNEGSSGASYAAQIKKYRKLTQQQPSNVAAWEDADEGAAARSGRRSLRHRHGHAHRKGRELFTEAAQSWSATWRSTRPSRTPNWRS